MATSVVTRTADADLVRFFEAVKNNEWPELRQLRTWLGSTDNVEAYAIRCSGRITVVVVKTSLELLRGAQWLYTESLPLGESARLFQTTPDLQWLSL